MSGLEKAKYVVFGRGQQNAANYVWQDREVRFDSPAAALDRRPRKTVIDTLVSCSDLGQSAFKTKTHAGTQSHIEDTKGNNGEQGQLTMTKLRIMWVSDRSHRTNLCIAYNCIVSLNIKQAGTRLRGANLCHIHMQFTRKERMLAVHVILCDLHALCGTQMKPCCCDMLCAMTCKMHCGLQLSRTWCLQHDGFVPGAALMLTADPQRR